MTFRADLPTRRLLRRRTRLRIVAGVVVALLLVLVVAWIQLSWLSGLPNVPSADALWSLNRAPGMTFLDRKGATIAVRGPRHGRRVSLAELPAYVPRAFLAAEDRRFYQHGAVDWLGVLRAAFADARAGAPVQGGSGLTQQLAKTLFLGPDHTLKRKLQEAVLAMRLSHRLSKDQILELYLNRIFFGSSAYGVEAASETYFDRPASALTLSEAALLAALPKAPSRLSPVADMPAALARSHLVLQRMVAAGWIDQAAERDALASPPRLAPEPPEDEDFGYVLDLAQTEATALARGKAPDLIVQLSIDSGLQTTAAQIARRVMESQGRAAGAGQAALAALGPDADILALVGGLDHRFSRFDRAVQALRQPGSAFKPLVYAAALEAGIKPTDIRQDAPIRLGPWAPENYGGGYAGPVTVEDALVRSINTVSVRLAQEIGTPRIAELASRFGIGELPPRPELSVALGAYETSLVELTSAYQVFQQGGRRQEPWLISQITTSSGQIVYSRPPAAPQAVYPAALNVQMVRMLEGVITRGTGRRAALGRPAAGKTGTSQAWRDAWFVGFTPELVAGVWVGNDDDRPMNKVAGGDLPADIWRRFMLAAEAGLPVRDFAFAPGPASPAAPASDAPAVGERAQFYRGLSQDFAETAAGEAGR
ncbi:MAG TPA: PBP1A family penicillin-binding protein [Caulobacteraceae bacterium]